MVEEREQRSRNVSLTHYSVDQSPALVELDVEGGIAEDAEPQD